MEQFSDENYGPTTNYSSVSDYYKQVTWIELKKSANGENDKNENDQRTTTTTTRQQLQDQKETERIVPLYPLPAVYVPSPGKMGIINHTLVNVEPQNVRMALDLLARKCNRNEGDNDGCDGFERQFCVVLRAVDSGRIATIGTIMTILDADVQLHYHASSTARRSGGDRDDEGDKATIADTRDFEYYSKHIDDIARIRLTCCADSLVEIIDVENPDAFSPKNRIIYKSDEYLRAKVRPLKLDWTVKRNDSADDEEEQGDLTKEMNTIIKDYSTIKTIYQLELGSEDFPPRWLAELGKNMPVITNMMASSDSSTIDTSAPDVIFEQQFWSFVQEWLSVCLTLRQGQQAMFSTERNEVMIEAASAMGGPLKLPIHLEDLDPQTRLGIQKMEREAQQKYLQLAMDPVLDFQVLISQSTWPGRVRWLKNIVAGERRRLEGIASSRY